MTILAAVGIAVAAAVAVGGLAILLRRTQFGSRRERWHDLGVTYAGAVLAALFLVCLALSVVISWGRIDAADRHVKAESNALTRMWLAAGSLERRDRLMVQQGISGYIVATTQEEWPRLAHGEVLPEAEQRMERLHSTLLAAATPTPATQAARTEMLTAFRDALSARQDRIDDATSTFPSGLLACLIVCGVAVIAHALLAGVPHSPVSLTPLLIQTALVAGAVFVVFAIRRPFGGAIEISPEHLQIALARMRIG